jgi:NADPH-dependent glutamate synthase beta subunit-like oxidoreductase/2,4-dienoyl-CoA reductase-like NADH-dependent reductase (Old Yellow Enzyme family)
MANDLPNANDFPTLFSPIKLGSLEVKNRIGGSCTTTGGADANGFIREECIYSYAARSEGGAGFITIECTFATDWGAKTTSFGNPRISGRSYYEGMSNLAEGMQQCGSKAFIQITPSFGRQGSSKTSGEVPGAPSAIPSQRPQDFEQRIMPRGYETKAATLGATTPPKMLTLEEIHYMETTFPTAVQAARICGFDAVEFHSPHGYLIHQFLSPRSNQRTDEYGGSLENRFRFLKNLLIATRKRVGPDFVLGIRLSGDEHMPGSIHEEELIQVAKWCEELGASYIHLSDGSYEARSHFFPQDGNDFIAHAKHFKPELKIPLIVPGQHDPYLAEEILRKGWADMITMGRQLVADQRWPSKVQEGRIDEINRCLRCNVCLARFNRGLAIRCAVNPNIGREKYDPVYTSANNASVLRPLPPSNQPPCEHECPAHLDINRYMLQAARGYFEDAYRSLKRDLAFPGVIGRVCPHPCEEECNRGKFEENQEKAIGINNTKRFISDYVMEHGLPDYLKKQALPENIPVTKKEKVAVVGAGPAGLSAAYFLSKKGYAVTVFEALPVAGGMMTVGVPEHRLPKKVVNWEIDNIKKMGVTIKTNSPVKDIEALKKDGYKAVFLATGLQNSMKLNVLGEDAKGVVQALSFLKDINLGKKVAVGKNVIVVGGGSVAMDVAMSAKRLGAESVLVTCLECSYEEMPAEKTEVAQAEDEGVKIDMSWGPKQIFAKAGQVSGVELKRCTQCYDKSGKFAPKYAEGETKKVEADMVITAIGQASDLNFLAASSKVKTTKRGTFEVDARSYATNVPGIFAGGDILGAGLMIKAMADGREAAKAIDCYLQGKELPPVPPQPYVADVKDTIFAFHVREEPKEDRVKAAATPVKERKGTKEINLGFPDKETCTKEARRCLTCRCTSIRY